MRRNGCVQHSEDWIRVGVRWAKNPRPENPSKRKTTHPCHDCLHMLMRWLLLSLTTAAAFQAPHRKPRHRCAAASVLDEGGWRFEGRFIFAPQLVKVPTTPPDAFVANVFGWTLGGVVALEYDSSLVGPYLEFVEMGALVVRNGALGQWGTRLLVSSEEAQKACEDVWRVPAGTRTLSYLEDGETLTVTGDDAATTIGGWGRVRGGLSLFDWRSPALPVLWTPQIKALWAPVKLPSTRDVELDVHVLGLSAKSVALRRFEDRRASAGRIPLGFALAADGLRIDIAPCRGDRL